MRRVVLSLIALRIILAATAAHADIFQWEYINPTDPSQGKRQSTTLCPDGAGVDSWPGAQLWRRNLTMAYLIGATLTDASLFLTDLTDADLSQANLTNADFEYAYVVGADFSNAEVRGARFRNNRFAEAYVTITLAQLYSTASYQAHDLTGIGLYETNLAGGNFAGQNLTHAALDYAYLTGADFTNAEVRGARFTRRISYGVEGSGITLAQLYSTASYAAHDLSGIGLAGNNLSGANFSGFNLTGANLGYGDLTGADFTNAEVRGASFDGGSGITLSQLYSTASYAAHDLSGIGLRLNDLSGANFSGFNLTGANMSSANLRGANFAGANLTNAWLYETLLDGADFTSADTRGTFLSPPEDATTVNLIEWDGHINGLDLATGGLLVVRDDNIGSLFDPDAPPIPITVDEHLAIGPGGTLRMAFEADAWDSTISFAPGIPVTLGGTLELTFADGIDLTSQVGRTFDLFNWDGVSPTGAFAISSPYAWDLSNLYTIGEVTLTAIPEPATSVLIGLGLLGLVVCVRRSQPTSNPGFNTEEESHTEAQRRGCTCFIDSRAANGTRFPILVLETEAKPQAAGMSHGTSNRLRFSSNRKGHSIHTTILHNGFSMRPQRLCVILFSIVAFANAAHANIFQWEYVNPTDPSQGKRQSAMLAADGAGVRAMPGGNLSYLDLTMAYLIGADLTGAFGYDTDLTNADLSQANFTNAFLVSARLAGANLTGARVQGADLSGTTAVGFSAAQLYSTASYQSRDLTGIKLYWNDLRGWSFAGQNLAGAVFGEHVIGQAGGYRPAAMLKGADFTAADLQGANFTAANLNDVNFNGAGIQGAIFNRYLDFDTGGTGIALEQLYSTASYKAGDLSGISLQSNNLSGANFAGQNLANADFSYASLTGADFSGALIRGARFERGLGTAGLSAAQLYSTASYVARELSGISLRDNNLSGVNFAGQNLTGADFTGAILNQTDFTDADLRGARFTIFVRDDQTGQSVRSGGIALPQLYSTASYKTHDLSGISVPLHSFDGANFARQNLSGANFAAAALMGANFSKANLSNTTFEGAKLAGADFTGADVRKANFHASYDDNSRTYVGGVTLAQLYATASYQAHDLNGVGLLGNDFAGGNFVGQNLSDANFTVADLTGADFSQSNLQNASLNSAVLTAADFTGADVRGAGFVATRDNRGMRVGISLAQLYSTASYQARDLSGIALASHSFGGADFSGQNLDDAAFDNATLADADFRGANLADASFWYATLSGADFRGANLSHARFYYATLSGADFTGADVRGANFFKFDDDGTGIALAQLYSTASYQAHDLSGIDLLGNNLTGGNFAGQNLTNASFQDAELNGADFSAADMRGAVYAIPADANTTNFIQRDGTIGGLELGPGQLLLVRDHDGDGPRGSRNSILPIPIIVGQRLVIDAGGTLRMVFEADAWDSTVSLAPDIPVTLGGTLELTFAEDVDRTSQVGRTFDLFDWTGVNPTGAFAVSSLYRWDLSHLYTTGEVTLIAVPEPTSLLVLAMAVGASIWSRQRAGCLGTRYNEVRNSDRKCAAKSKRGPRTIWRYWSYKV
jgi:uncharacterized protein YjbI with pentapeptide repeats